MENDKPNINEELDHIKDSMNKKKDKLSDEDSFIILDKIISKSTKKDYKTDSNIKLQSEDDKKDNNNSNNSYSNEGKKKPIVTKKNTTYKKHDPVKKTKDPVAALVDREIKPIIKKWIGKNLKSFVKTIVIQEMKLISKATQKHK